MKKPKTLTGIDSHHGKWRYRFKLKNNPRASVVTALEATSQNLNAAYDLMREHKMRLILGEPEPIQAVLFIDAADHFQAAKALKHRDKPTTAKRVKGSLASAREYFGDKMLMCDITGAGIEDYMTWRRGHEIKDVTLRKDVLALRMLSRHAIARRWIQADPTEGIEMPSDEESMNSRIITDEEERAYLAVGDTYPALGDFARIMLRQGMRPSEVVALETDVIDFKTGMLRVTKGKSNAAKRALKIHTDVAPILGRRVAEAEAHGSPYLFPFLTLNDKGQVRATDWSKPQSAEQVCKTTHNRVCKIAGLDFVPYSLRHTFATRAYRHKPDLLGLMRVLGHSSLKIVQRYVNDAEQHAREFMEAFEKREAQTEREVVQ